MGSGKRIVSVEWSVCPYLLNSVIGIREQSIAYDAWDH